MRSTPNGITELLRLAFRLKPIRSVQSQAESGLPSDEERFSVWEGISERINLLQDTYVRPMVFGKVNDRFEHFTLNFSSQIEACGSGHNVLYQHNRVVGFIYCIPKVGDELISLFFRNSK